jgi:CrcB protein
VSFAPSTLVAVALGGAVGSVLRWAAESALPAPAGAFPLGTLLVNVAGSAVLGAVVVLLDRGAPASPHRAFLATGLLGGFTTFSTYAVQVALLGGTAPAVALTYAVLTPAVCVGAAWAGAAGARASGTRAAGAEG